MLPEAERRVVAVQLAQLDGRGPWEALLLVNEGPVHGATPKLYAFANVGGTWSLLDEASFDASAVRNEDEGGVALRTAPLLGPCHAVVWVDLDVSNWADREEYGDGEYLRRDSSLVMLADGHLETRVTCEVAMRTETHDEERLIEGTNTTLSWSPDDPFPKPIRVRRRTGLGESIRLDGELMVVDQDETFEVEGWARASVVCRR